MRTTFTTLAAATFAASLPLSLALAAGLPIGDEPPASPATVAESPAAALQAADQLLKDNKPVAARALLVKAFQQGKTVSDESASGRAMSLLGEANRQIAKLDPLDLSLQKAQVALDANDVRIAERQAQAVLKSAGASSTQSDKARALIAAIEAKRSELSPIIPDALAQAQQDFKAGRYAQSKQGFELVDRSGVPLTVEQQSTLDQYQMKLVSLAAKDPEVVSGTASMGMMQPGVVKRRDDQPMAQPPATPDKPADKPADQPAPKPADKPAAPAPAPAAAQPPKTTPPPTPAEDPVNQARKFEAKSQIDRGDKAFDSGNLATSMSIYNRVLNEYKDSLTADQRQHVENRLQEARVKLGTPGTAPRPEDVIREGKIIHDRAVAEFDSDMGEADKSLKSGAMDQASQLAARARLRISSARQYFPESEYENLNTKVTNFLADVERARLKAEDEARRAQEDATKKSEADKAKTQRTERERKIVELIDRARAYQVEKRYDEALQAVDQLLFLDPINPTGLLMKDLITDIKMYAIFNNIYDRKQEGYAYNSLDNQKAAIPPANVVTFPEDWPAISIRRGEPVQFAETPENRKTLAEISSPTAKIPTVAFNNNPLQDAVKFLETVSRQNIDVDWASLEEKGITKETAVSMNMTSATPRQVLDRLVEKVSGADRGNRADWAVIDGQVVIASDEKIRKNTVLVIYDIRDLLLEVPDYRDVPQIDLQQALQAAQGGGGGGGGGRSPFKDTQGQNQQEQRRERDAKMDDIIKIITDNVDYDNWVDNGGDTGKIQKIVNQGNLIITNTPKNQRAVGGLLSKLREIRAMQINVETRFLLVNQSWFEQIGFNLDVVFNANNGQFRAVHAADPTALPSDFFDFTQPNPVKRDVSGAANPLLPPNPAANNATRGAPPAGVINQATPNPSNWSPIGVFGDSLGLASALAPQTGITADVLGKAPALGIAGQFLDDVQVDFLIKATQADRRSIQLTAPRLTFTNGQTANIYVASQQAFISDLTPVVGDSAVGFDPTVGVVTEGVTLLVEGTVTADRRYVQLNVDAGIARIDGFGSQPVVALAGGQLVNSTAVQQFIQLPKVTVTRVRTTVTVPDQGTILMGGQRLVTESEVETGVPVLSKIPIINRFFTNRIESREEQTLLILLKPTILIQNEEEERHFPGLLDSYRSGIGG